MKDLTISLNVSIKDALRSISTTGEKCVIVVDEDRKLLGTLSDGDLRKAILKGYDVTDSIEKVFNPKPTSLTQGRYSVSEAKRLFLENKFDVIPIIDDDGKVIDVLVWEKLFADGENAQEQVLDTGVVIMAGGKGTRLEPFTKVLPKPLVPIHEKPIIEHIIERFRSAGVTDFRIAINYKSRILKAYFEEMQHDYSVSFLEEKEPLGTAGSLKFLKREFDKPFFVTNCDIIINGDYLDLFNFHKKNGYNISLVASMKNYVIPYGTCELNGEGYLDHIKEKPEFDFLVNTGLYVVNPELLDFIPNERKYHMTDLIQEAKLRGMKVGVYPISEDAWIDVGQWAEYQKAVERL